MRNKWKERSGEIAGWLGVFLLIMLIVGILLDSKLRDLLNIYLENQVALQTEILAETVGEKLSSETRMLEGIAEYIEEEEGLREAALQMLMLEDTGTTAGMLNINGEAVLGEQLPIKEFPGIHESIHGHNGICYNNERGLLFTVPVYHGDNIKYILYKLFPKEILVERFAVTSYGEEGKIAICDREGHLVVPILDWTEEEHMLFQSEVMMKGLAAVKREMIVETAAAKRVVYEDKEWFVFVAEIEQTDFNLTGAVSKEVLSEGIEYIVTLVLWVFGLLLVLLLIGIIYLLVVEGKARESDELREAKQTAERENRAKSEFLAQMSHEIRTPINAVMGMNEMILRESSEANVKRYAWNIQSASRNLLAIINDILDFSKIESGKMEIAERNYSIGEMLYDIVNIIYVRAREKELELLVEIDETLPDEVCGDEMKVRKILINVLSNAVKYTKAGSVSLKVSGSREGDTAVYCISVKDTGIGIREEDKARLFDDFARLDREKNRDIEGTGLGLAITFRLLEQMGGRIEVESVYGEGSVFTIYLPQKVVGRECISDLHRRASVEEKEETHYYESFVAPEAKVLVVDDTEVNLLVVKGLLKSTEIQVTTCLSGAECLELVQKNVYDLILLDHMMPEMDGIETLKQMKKLEHNLCKDAPVIVLTANAIVGVREMYLEEGFDDYLSKPIEGPILERVIQKYLPESKLTVAGRDVFSNEVTEKEGEKKTVIDRNIGLEYCSGMEDIYQEVLEAYYEEGQDYLKKMAEYQNNKDWKNYAIIVHAIKSTSLTIGATELSEAAKEQELAAKAGNEEVIAAKWEAVHAAFKEVLEEVKNMLTEEK